MNRQPTVEPAEVERRNARFLAEVVACGFRWRCGDCTHVVPSTGACSMGCPNGFYAGPPHALQSDGALAFCKYFELGAGV